jgi:hypothetical protein
MRRLVRVLLAAAIALPVVSMAGGVQYVQAANGLAVTNITTYTVDGDAGVVRASVDLTLTNVKPDTREGNFIRSYFFTGFSVPVPVGASNPVAVTSNGRALTVVPEIIAGFDGYYVLGIEFASNLDYRETLRLTLTYDLLGQPPRDPNPSRANGAYAAFNAYGVGDAGEVTVRVVVPPDWQVDQFGDDAVITVEDGNTVYTAADIESPDEFNLFISARNDGALASAPVTVDGNEFDLRHWPGDDEWRAFVEEQITEGLPVLETLIGQEWPRTGTFEVRQANTPYLYGYAGWFSGRENEIEMGEDLDQETALHELSHAWFNDDLFSERWLNEGFAQVYSNLAVDELGGEAAEPRQPRATEPGAVELTSWGNPSFTVDDADESEEDFGYNASWYVIDELVGEVGVEDMAVVLDGMTSKANPYAGEVEADRPFAATWQQFLDHVENTAGEDTQVEELFTEWVLIDAQAEQLAERAEARDTLAGLDADGGEWDVPVGIRNDMGRWQFEDATEAMADAAEVLVLRDEMVELSDALGVDVPGDFETDYQAVDDGDFAAVTADIEDQIDALQVVQAAVAAEAEEPSFVEQVGLIGTDVQTPLDEAKAAVGGGFTDEARADSARVTEILGRADDVGTGRVVRSALALLGLIALIVALVWWRRRRRRRRAADAAVSGSSADPMVLLGAGDGDDRDELETHDIEASENGQHDATSAASDGASIDAGGADGGGADGGGADGGGGAD